MKHMFTLLLFNLPDMCGHRKIKCSEASNPVVLWEGLHWDLKVSLFFTEALERNKIY